MVIDDRTQARSELTAGTAGAVRTHAFTQAILDNLFTFVALLERDGTVVDANDVPLRAAGITIDEVRGKKFWDTYWWNYSAEVQAELRDACRRAAAGETMRYEVVVRMARDARMAIDFQIAPLRDAKGDITHLVPSAVDITDRKQSEQALRESERAFRGTFENAAVGIAHVGLDGAWLRVNDRLCDIVGYTKDELLLAKFQDITHPDDIAADLSVLESMRRGEQDYYRAEKRYIRKNGKPVWILLTVTLQRDHEGRPLYCISVIQDIHDRKQAEEALLHLNRTLEDRILKRTRKLTRQRRQLQRLAHELTAAEQRERKNLAYALHEGLQQLVVAAKTRLQLARGQGATHDLNELDRLLDRILDEARSVTYSLTPPVLYDSDLPHALEWLVRWYELQCQFNVHLAIAPDFPPLSETEKFFLFGVIRELLLNAATHAGVDTADVSLGREADLAVIEVSDQGRGFCPDALEAEHDLTGFGLFSIRERLSALGGQFEVSSSPGAGARLRVKLPASQAQGIDAEDGFVAPGGPDDGKPAEVEERMVRVLLADDHDMVRKGLSMILQRTNRLKIVGEAASGREAVDLADRLHPDVVLMDVTMPEMDGIEATQRIKEHHPHMQVIGLSMHQEMDMAMAMRDAGASDYLRKDDAAGKLHDAIHALFKDDGG